MKGKSIVALLADSKEGRAFLRKKYFSWRSGDLRAFRAAFYKRRWEDAIKVGERHCEKRKQDFTILPHLALSYHRNNEKGKANDCMRRYLEYAAGASVEDLIQSFREKTSLNTDSLCTSYNYWGGSANLGFFEHTDKVTNVVYITKIMSGKLLTKVEIEREYYFYDKIQVQSEAIRRHTPEFADWTTIICPRETLYFLTTRKIKGYKPSKDNLQQMLEASTALRNSKSEEMKKTVEASPPGSTVLMRLTDKGIVYKINHIRMLYKAKKLRSKGLREQVDAMAEFIRKAKPYKKIDTECEYALCHFDYHKGNLLIEEESGCCVIMDWSNYHLGLEDSDVINLFRSLKTSFEVIERQYLSSIDTQTAPGKNRAVLFVYWLFFQSVMRQKRTGVSERMEAFYTPALKFLKALV